MENKKMDKKYILIVVALLIICSLVIALVYYLKYGSNKENNVNLYNNGEISVYNEDNNKSSDNIVDRKEIQIYRGNSRLVAVMIDNEQASWPHSGLENAYMVYEAIIEGGETRLMALFKGQDVNKVGAIRSTRHYFAEYALEHNAILVHYGWSPKAEQVIENNHINNINGVTSDSSIFFRIGSGYHNAFTSMPKIQSLAADKKYTTTSLDKSLYTIKAEEFSLTDGKQISDVYIKYSDLHNVSYKYDVTRKVFLRSMRGKRDVDKETTNQYFAKNIIIIKAKNYTMSDGENKGRQEIDIVGSGSGYFLTDGKYIDITWKKDSIKGKTYIYNTAGQEIVLNDGITYFQIVPIVNDNVKFTLVESNESKNP
jgi:hypothetical protein